MNPPQSNALLELHIPDFERFKYYHWGSHDACHIEIVETVIHVSDGDNH